MDALKIGNARNASAAAAVTNGRNVNENPLRALNSAFDLSRSFAIFVMSTRCTVVTCAEVRLLMTMCSAIFCRMLLMGSVRVLAASGKGMAGGGAEGACGAGAGGACGVGAAYVLAACEDMYASTSCLVMRPPAPVPLTCERSMLYSRAILRTSGESGPRSSSACGCAAGWGC